MGSRDRPEPLAPDALRRDSNSKPTNRMRMGRLLDIGCGEGGSLRDELGRSSTAHNQQIQAVGVDINLELLLRSKKIYPDFHFVCARGEQLPFRDQSFDTVISRVAIPYMDIPVTLREVSRVLKPGCELHMKLFPFSYTLSELLTELSHGPISQRLKNLVFRLYVIANGFALHLFGFNFRFPLVRRFSESFQTKRGIRQVLTAAGFRRSHISCWETKIDRPHSGNCRVTAVR